jgi:addiction module RelE/StbE family toxin
MIDVRYHRKFKKKYYDALPLKVKAQFRSRLELYCSDPQSSALRVHALKGKYIGAWSFDVTGDYRVIFEREGDHIIVLLMIGTHSQLY